MEPKYYYAESTIKPDPIYVDKTTVFLRKDICSEEIADASGNKYTLWEYKEAKMLTEDFEAYSNMVASVNAVKGINDSENISKIVENGSNSDNNQLIIMEAIADLYDIITSLGKGGTND